jgi:hypothetical protein
MLLFFFSIGILNSGLLCLQGKQSATPFCALSYFSDRVSLFPWDQNPSTYVSCVARIIGMIH